MTSAIASGTSVKMVQEALCYAECATLNFYPDNGQRAGYARILADLIANCKRQRPTGTDGKHDDRHTASCGCRDAAGEAQAVGPAGGGGAMRVRVKVMGCDDTNDVDVEVDGPGLAGIRALEAACDERGGGCTPTVTVWSVDGVSEVDE